MNKKYFLHIFATYPQMHEWMNGYCEVQSKEGKSFSWNRTSAKITTDDSVIVCKKLKGEDTYFDILAMQFLDIHYHCEIAEHLKIQIEERKRPWAFKHVN